MFNFKMSKTRQQELLNICNFSNEEAFIFNNLVENKSRKEVYSLTYEKFDLSESTVKRRIRSICKKISNCTLGEDYTFKIYMHIFPDGKKYVGVCQNCRDRWHEGNGYAYNEEMYKEIQKYGWNNIEHKVLLEVTDGYIAYAIEKLLINELDLVHKGFNRM